MKLKKLFETGRLAVIDKPVGFISENIEKESGFMPCHRLDKETSGCWILAKDEETKDRIQGQFKKRKVLKEYSVLVYGNVLDTVKKVWGRESFNFSINAPIGRNPVTGERFAVVQDGREAETDFEVVGLYKGGVDNIFTLLRCFPKTGRTHQIRVHLTALGHPVYGDALYAGEKRVGESRDRLGRIFLHASRIEFKNPWGGEEVRVECELPEELGSFVRGLEIEK